MLGLVLIPSRTFIHWSNIFILILNNIFSKNDKAFAFGEHLKDTSSRY